MRIEKTALLFAAESKILQYRRIRRIQNLSKLWKILPDNSQNTYRI